MSKIGPHRHFKTFEITYLSNFFLETTKFWLRGQVPGASHRNIWRVSCSFLNQYLNFSNQPWFVLSAFTPLSGLPSTLAVTQKSSKIPKFSEIDEYRKTPIIPPKQFWAESSKRGKVWNPNASPIAKTMIFDVSAAVDELDPCSYKKNPIWNKILVGGSSSHRLSQKHLACILFNFAESMLELLKSALVRPECVYSFFWTSFSSRRDTKIAKNRAKFPNFRGWWI